MSILIKGAEMPKSCMLCSFCVEEADPANGEMCMVTGTLMPPCTRERLDNCPLAPIPPHGRLGDLDELVEKIDGIWDCNDMVFKPDDHCCNVPEDCKGCKWAQTKDYIQRMVENAPTIIPAEEGE